MAGLNGGKLFGQPAFDFLFDRQKFPIAAPEFIKPNKIRGNMSNEMSWGGVYYYQEDKQ